MTKLLVSVRNAAEARVALSGGADLIDVKEPSRGPLGAADSATIASVVAEVNGQVPVSAALGELRSAEAAVVRQVDRVDFAKFGLSGCAGTSDWVARLAAAIQWLPVGVVPVAVAYADWHSADAPDPWDVLTCARTLRRGAVLIDTFDKKAGSLGELISRTELERWICSAREAGLTCVVAGRIEIADVDTLLPLGPDYIGVRGAVCRGGRTGPLDAARLRRLKDLVHDRSRGAIDDPTASSAR